MLTWKDKGWWRRLRQPDWWAGPIFDKELRVASRRRRNYSLRCAYVLLLTAYIAAVWIPAVALPRFGAMSRAQMQVAAHTITQGIVWFQFFGAQAVALLLMSTAIGGEVQSRTLCALMTTPLSSHQIVMNKLCSRLFQVLLLVAASLPLLSVVRVLGGIAWGYLLVSLCVTAATVIFVGSVSLFFSVLCRRPHIAVTVSALSLAFVFGFVPIFLRSGVGGSRWSLSELAALNPYILLQFCPNLPTPAAGRVVVGVRATITCCVLLLLAARGLLAGSARLVDRIALPRALGDPVLLDRLRRGRWREGAGHPGPERRRTDIRRVVGPPMVWKEMTCTLSSRQKFATKLVVGIEVLLILMAYAFPVLVGIIEYESLHLLCLWVFLGLGALATITASATVFSGERESGTWPLLLLTPLTDREILLGKFVGVLRRCGPVWLSLLAYIVAFTAGRCFSPIAIAQVAILIVTVLVFLTATGFYFGSRCRRTTDAVTATLACAGLLWCAIPIVGAAAEVGMKQGGVCLWISFLVVPFVQALAVVITTLEGYAGGLHWFGHYLEAPDIAVWMLFSMVGYVLVSLVFAWRAVCAFRRRIV